MTFNKIKKIIVDMLMENDSLSLFLDTDNHKTAVRIYNDKTQILLLKSNVCDKMLVNPKTVKQIKGIIISRLQ